MYNSTIGYASKLIKGSIVFSIIIFISLSQLMTVTSIFSLVWKYEILLNENIPFFRIFYICFIYRYIYNRYTIFFNIKLVLSSLKTTMFSTLRIFGATKLAIRKLAILISLLYPFIYHF